MLVVERRIHDDRGDLRWTEKGSIRLMGLQFLSSQTLRREIARLSRTIVLIILSVGLLVIEGGSSEILLLKEGRGNKVWKRS